MLIVTIQVYIGSLTGVHHLFLRYPGLGTVGLLGRLLLLRLGLFGLRLLCLGRCRLLFLCLGSGRLLLCLTGGLLCAGLSALGIDLFDALDLMMLGHILHNIAQLCVGQNLHVVLRRCAVGNQNFGDLFCAQAKVLGQFMNAILVINTQCQPPPDVLNRLGFAGEFSGSCQWEKAGKFMRFPIGTNG